MRQAHPAVAELSKPRLREAPMRQVYPAKAGSKEVVPMRHESQAKLKQAPMRQACLAKPEALQLSHRLQTPRHSHFYSCGEAEEGELTNQSPTNGHVVCLSQSQ